MWQSIIKWAHDNDFEIHCKYINIEVGDALYNASKRLIDTYGKLLNPEEIKKTKEVGVYTPIVIYKYRKTVQTPKKEEGFHSVEKIRFKRINDKTEYTEPLITEGGQPYSDSNILELQWVFPSTTITYYRSITQYRTPNAPVINSVISLDYEASEHSRF